MLTRDLVYPLVALNTAGIDGLRRCPRFVFDTQEADAEFNTFSMGIQRLTTIGVQIPESWVHDKLKIPAPHKGEAVLTPPTSGNPAALTAHHGQGCQCPGCTGLAALKSDPQSMDIQDQLDRLAPPGQHDQAQAVIRPLLDALREGMSPEQALDAVAEVYPQMDDDLLTEALARALFAAELAGRLEAQDEPA